MLASICLMPATVLALAYIYYWHKWIKIVFGLLAIPLSIPWLAALLSIMLSGMAPTIFGKAPASEGIKLQINSARDFRSLPIGERFKKIYVYYVVNTIPSLIFIIVSFLIMYVVTHGANRLP
jgi:hypothetical protein